MRNSNTNASAQESARVDPKNQVNGGNVSDCIRHNFGTRLAHPSTNVRLDPGAAPAAASSAFLVKSLSEKPINEIPRPQSPGRILALYSADLAALLRHDHSDPNFAAISEVEYRGVPRVHIVRNQRRIQRLGLGQKIHDHRRICPFTQQFGGEECTDADPTRR